MRSLLCGAALSVVSLLVHAGAQVKKPLADAGIATCDYPHVTDGGSRWVTSTAGYAAAVELLVTVTGTGENRNCVTSWRLHLRDTSGAKPTLTVAEREDKPEDNEWGQENWFEIIGWSRDGKRLVASQSEVEGDGDVSTPIVYDFVTGKHWRVELDPLFQESYIPADCYVVYRVLGFDASGGVRIEAMSTDDDREAEQPPCFPDSRWVLDYQKNTIRRAIPNSVPVHSQ